MSKRIQGWVAKTARFSKRRMFVAITGAHYNWMTPIMTQPVWTQVSEDAEARHNDASGANIAQPEDPEDDVQDQGDKRDESTPGRSRQSGGKEPLLFPLAATKSKVQPTSSAKTRRAFRETVKRNEDVRTKRLMRELRDIQRIIASQQSPVSDFTTFQTCSSISTSNVTWSHLRSIVRYEIAFLYEFRSCRNSRSNWRTVTYLSGSSGSIRSVCCRWILGVYDLNQ